MLKEAAEAEELALDVLPVGTAVRAFMDGKDSWEETATDLLALLNDRAGEAPKDRSWPKKAHILSGQLKRLASSLRRLGVEVEWTSGADGARLLVLINHLTKEDQMQRQQCQPRQDRPDDADFGRAPERQAASRPDHEASNDFNGNPHQDAKNRKCPPTLGTVDTIDAVFGSLLEEIVAAASAERERFNRHEPDRLLALWRDRDAEERR